MQAAACPGGVERGPLRGTGDFPGKARRISAKGSKPFGAKHKPRFLGNDAWRGDSRSLRGVAADGGPRVRIHLPPAESLRTIGSSAAEAIRGRQRKQGPYGALGEVGPCSLGIEAGPCRMSLYSLGSNS